MNLDLIIKNKSLKELNWWKVGGESEFFASPKTVVELKDVWHWAWKEKIKIWIMSGGSNVLIKEGLLKGLLISLHELKGIESIEINGEIKIRALTGTSKSEIAKIFIQNKLAPAVFLTGIPGDMGAGVVMNAGIGENRVPREFCEIVKSIEVLRINDISGEFSTHEILSRDIKWEYRHSSGWQPGIITHVTVAWSNEPGSQFALDVREQTRKRVTSQPLDLPNCGSVFRNPAGHKSAQLIDSCGLKGFRIGGAAVSTKHANFIVNDHNAKSEEIHKVIEHVRATVLEKTGVELKTEVVYLGDW
jgi:UDP-N-acetylmuramate dehydrogenase